MRLPIGRPTLIGFLTLITCACLSVRPTAAAPADDDGSTVYQKVVKSTVWILSPREKSPNGGRRMSTGTGSLVDKKLGLVLTNYHVVGDIKEAIVVFPIFQKTKLLNNREDYLSLVRSRTAGVAATVVAKDTKRDLALIQLPSVPDGIPALKVAPSGAMPGQNIHSIGNPGASPSMWVYTSGKVRSAAVHMKWKAMASETETLDFEAEVLVTSSPTNPGDSGGPLVNDKGELVGVTQGGAADAQQISYFIDVSEVRPFLTKKGIKIAPPPAVASATETPADDDVPKSKPPAATLVDDTEKLEKQATTKLKLAKTLAQDGLKGKARERLEKIVEDFPKTKAAEEAKQLLLKLK